MRAVIYARYSSDLQREASIEDQIRLCQTRIDTGRWALVNTYTDAALSGASRFRPGYQKLLEDARHGDFDIVVAEALDRLSRDQEDIAGLYKTLAFHGVKLVTLSEGEINELHIGLKGTMNALFLKDLALKIRRGQQGRVTKGFSAGGLSYGYDVVRQIDDRGDLVRGQRRVNEREAQVIRRIFTDYIAGKSPRQIAAELNAQGIPSPRGGQWNTSTINGHRARRNGILQNEAYRGVLVHNRLRMVKDPQTGRRISRLNPPNQWHQIEVTHLRIVPDELWEKAQSQKARFGHQPVHKSRRPKRLFSGLLRCGSCGGSLSIIRPGKYGCSTHREKGTCSNSRQISVDRLERRLLEGIVARLSDVSYQSQFVDEFHKAFSSQCADVTASNARAKKELQIIEQKIERIVAAIAEGTDTPSLRRALTLLEDERMSGKRQLGAPDLQRPLPAPKQLRSVYQQKVRDLAASLNADASTVTDASLVFRRVLDRIVVTPGAARGRASVEVFGDPSSAVLFGQEDTVQNRMIKVVAEERYRRSPHWPELKYLLRSRA